jgi:pimeloyl-ACP methyl ester carboxylesterase/DNA-binding CsgD family transcriptional regulator
VNQQIRFCSSFDGTRLAYALVGEGPVLVRAPQWLTHLEYEWGNPVFRPFIDALSRHYTYVRADQRGCGLSDRSARDISIDTWVRDFEAVVAAARVERFALLGVSQGGAIAIEYAARHPEQVSHLVLLGAYARGWMRRGLPPEQEQEGRAQVTLVESGWGREDPAYRHLFSTQFVPGATLEQINALSELQRVSAAPHEAARIIEAMFMIDVQARAPLVQCPTLVLHARGDRRVPFEEGRRIAGLVPGARLVPLESDNHILLATEPAFQAFQEELQRFVPSATARPDARLGSLTAREAEILEHMARGLDNAQIAAHLAMSGKTVRNHITRIFDKLAVENRAQAIVFARTRGLGSPPGS